MAHLNEAYLVSSTTMKRTSAISLGRLQFPSLDYDFTLRMFFSESQTGDQFMPLCNDIVLFCFYESKNLLAILIDKTEFNSLLFKLLQIKEDDKAFVKRGLKRIHVSRSGMVVSDGNCIASMDHFGQIVSST
ncbi:unnamed protein product [Thelazia callipaeda]|uniref:Coatomer subunit zeta n=1 Tax=Thelazia callipaeda TaxID=103827 RepID=A0A0N5CNB1_THECL|nr:unnamed protein product [Thelazia callipaeda]